MLGETWKNNDVYIFFENNEIERLEHERIQGIYFNFKDSSKTCLLEAFIYTAMDELIQASGQKDEEGFMLWYQIKINQRGYDKLRMDRTAGTHEGYRHIELLDTKNILNLDFGERFTYRQLNHYRSNLSNR